MVNYGSEACVLQKVDEYFLDVFQRNCLRTVLGTRLTDRISNSRLCETCGSITLSRAIMEERLRWLGHVAQMKDDKQHKTTVFQRLTDRISNSVRHKTTVFPTAYWPYFKQSAVQKVSFNPAVWGYNWKKVEMARAHSVDEWWQIAKDCSSRPTA